MSELDFLKFKEFEADVSIELNVKGSGTWEVTITQGDSISQSVTLTADQINRIAQRCNMHVGLNGGFRKKTPQFMNSTDDATIKE